MFRGPLKGNFLEPSHNNFEFEGIHRSLYKVYKTSIDTLNRKTLENIFMASNHVL